MIKPGSQRGTIRPPRFGVMLPVFDSMGAGIPPVTETARMAEDLGFDTAWIGDHLFFHQPNYECLISVAFALAVTQELRVGSGVVLPALRDPVPLAKQLLTLEVASNGRLEVGVGVGGEFAPEWEAVGANRATRGVATSEFLDFFGKCLGGGPLDYTGTCISVNAPPFSPLPSEGQKPPVWVGGRSRRAMERATKYGTGWLAQWHSPRRVREARAELEVIAAAEGKSLPRVGMVVFVNVGSPAQARAEARSFVEQHHRLPFEKLEKWYLTGPKEHVASGLAELSAAGVEDFVLYPACEDPSTQFSELAEIRQSVLSSDSTPKGMSVSDQR